MEKKDKPLFMAFIENLENRYVFNNNNDQDKGIGQIFKEARLKKALPLELVSQNTKLRLSYIEAIENENYSVIPYPTYIIAFVKTLAKEYQVETKIADKIEDLEEQFNLKSSQEEEAPLVYLRNLRKRQRGFYFLSFFFILLLFFLFSFFFGEDYKVVDQFPIDYAQFVDEHQFPQIKLNIP